MPATQTLLGCIITVLLLTGSPRMGYSQEAAPREDGGGERTCMGILYAPSHDDNPAWRSELAALLGERVDYWDSRVSTPTLEALQEYCCVFTWTNYAYADPYAFGNNLADYVDGGGRVILGQWSWFGFDGDSALMADILLPEYCPVTVSCYGIDAYVGDGTDCVHTTGPVVSYASNYVDQMTLRPGAEWDGTLEGGQPSVAWRADRRVYYSAGNTASDYTTGDTAQLVANMYFCASERTGACCEPLSGTCVDDVAESQCQPPLNFYPNGICSAIEPACGEDCDGDGIADVEQAEYTDTALFVDQLLAERPDYAYVCMFDGNGDSLLNAQDIQGFVARLLSAP